MLHQPLIVLAGATGNLGGQIAKALRAQNANVRAIVRRGSSADKIEALRKLGVDSIEVNFERAGDVVKACSGASCVVSAVSGLRESIIESQTALVDAAILAGVPRFIPSDFSIDFTKLPPGSNRNLDLRREFREYLGQPSIQSKISVTSIFNGAFADMLTGQAPIVLFKFKRVLFWQSADQPMEFTSISNTAAFTARAALDESCPRDLHIAGDKVSARDLAKLMTELSGKEFKLLRAGDLDRLERIIHFARAVTPKTNALYPPWQGMQYLHNMFGGLAVAARLDNDRYPLAHWTTAREVLAAR